MTVAELVALAKQTTCFHGERADDLAKAILSIFDGLPDFPCGYDRASIKTTAGPMPPILYANDSCCQPEEAVALGLDLFEVGRRAMEARET